MIEKKIEGKVFIKRAMCECGGQFRHTPSNLRDALLRIPETYPHTCEKCGLSERFVKVYPSVEFEDVIPKEGI